MNPKLVKHMRYIPLTDLQAPPIRSGYVNVIRDKWWAVDPDKGALIYRGDSPQMNSKEHITRHLIAELYPECEAVFIPVAYLPGKGKR